MDKPLDSLWRCREHRDFQSCYDSWQCLRKTQHPGCVGIEEKESLNIPAPKSARGVKERSLPLLWHCLFRTEHFKVILLHHQPFGKTTAKCCLLRNQCLAYLISAPPSTASSSRHVAQFSGTRSLPVHGPVATGPVWACMNIPAIGTKVTEVGKQELSVDGVGCISLWLHPKPLTFLTWIKPGVPG